MTKKVYNLRFLFYCFLNKSLGLKNDRLNGKTNKEMLKK